MDNKIIRKVWIGKTVKEDSMSWHIGQTVRLGRDGDTGVVDHILEPIEGTFEIYVKKGGSIILWKKSTMDAMAEYDIVF